MDDIAHEPFSMQGAREAMAGGWPHIEPQVNAIERAIVENPALAFDLARVLIESTCRTLLDERSVAYSTRDDLPSLFRTVTQRLPFLPKEAKQESEVRTSLQKTLSGLNTALHGVCELRNQCGFASHGSDGHRPAMESVQARLAAQAADAIVGFFHRAHRQDRIPAPPNIPDYEHNMAFNDNLDEIFGPFRVHDVEFRASDVLYSMEPETYRIYLAEFDGEPEAIAQALDEGRP